MTADLSGVAYFAPVVAFLLVAAVVYLVLIKIKILGESPWANAFIALFVATLFVSAGGVRRYVEVVTPWFAVLVVSLFFVLFLVGFIGDKASFLHKGIGIGVIVAAVLIFLVSGFVVFSDIVGPYLPFGNYYGNSFANFIYSPRVVGAVVLLVIAGIVMWVLVRNTKK